MSSVPDRLNNARQVKSLVRDVLLNTVDGCGNKQQLPAAAAAAVSAASSAVPVLGTKPPASVHACSAASLSQLLIYESARP